MSRALKYVIVVLSLSFLVFFEPGVVLSGEGENICEYDQTAEQACVCGFFASATVCSNLTTTGGFGVVKACVEAAKDDFLECLDE